MDAYLQSDRGLTESRNALSSADGPTAKPVNEPPTEPSTTSAGNSIPEQIKKLGQLRDEGILTEEEFAHKKRELLDRM